MGSCPVGSVGGSAVVCTHRSSHGLHAKLWGHSWRDHRVLGCKLHNKVCFLASGGGTCLQRAVLGLFISASETGFSLVAGQMRFYSVTEK